MGMGMGMGMTADGQGVHVFYMHDAFPWRLEVDSYVWGNEG